MCQAARGLKRPTGQNLFFPCPEAIVAEILLQHPVSRTIVEWGNIGVARLAHFEGRALQFEESTHASQLSSCARAFAVVRCRLP